MTLTFLLETARTPIYRRIIASFQAALIEFGHRVLLVEPDAFESEADYLNHIQSQPADYCLMTKPMGAISTYIEKAEAFAFELIEIPLIFIHHDSCFSHLNNLQTIRQVIQAFQRVQHRSIHFCLEYGNFLDLRSLGIERVYSIPHASEFAASNRPDSASHDLSFVGHLWSSLGSNLENLPCSYRLRADFWQRLVQFDYRIEASALAFAQQLSVEQPTELERLAGKSLYISLMHLHSHYFRGEVIRRLEAEVDIFGGDPSYLHGVEPTRQIQQPNVKYHPPTASYSDARDLYAGSKINLNITSLQFDQAVINRVIDVAAAGGFVLTDWKADLPKLTSVAEQISYRSLEELNHKINYYLHPSHEQERLEIAAILRQDIQQHCTYPAVVELILSKLESMSPGDPSVNIDLGCGPWKAEGFIGVDIAPGPGVDLVADLSQRFPFADSSVDRVRAHDLVEHLADRIHTMNEIWRICKPDGLVDIRVPSTDGRGAFQDPTHISFWNINSFKYYCIEFPAYLKLCHTYGFRGEFKLEHLSEEASDDGVIHVNVLLRAIKHSSSAQMLKGFKLRTQNFLVCPDWEQPEAIVMQELFNLLKTVIMHPNHAQITLLIDTGSMPIEEVDSAIATLLMYLMTEEGIEIAEAGPEITLLDELTPQQWQALTPHLSAQIRLEQAENAAPVSLEGCPTIQLAELNQQAL